MGPVRVGNQAYRQVQNDVYGSAILAAARASFVAAFEGDTLDASLLLLAELGFLKADDPRRRRSISHQVLSYLFRSLCDHFAKAKKIISFLSK